MTPVEQALREALVWALTDPTERDVVPPPAIVMTTVLMTSDSRSHRRLTINDAYLDGLRGKP